LLQARKSHQLVKQTLHISQALEAYFVNEVVATELGWHSHEAARHWKSGGPGRNAGLTHAALDPHGVWPSPARATDWPLNHGGVEAEIALRLGCDVDAMLAASLSHETAPALVDALCAAIEVVSSRLAQPQLASPWDRMADAQSHGALVLGTWMPCHQRDWAEVCGELQVNQQPARPFTGTHSLDDPFHVLPAWLRHATRHGQVVRAGTVVTTGNWSGHTPVHRGDRVCVRFEGVGEAVVQL
jgi:2-keto-4-pentenoate hydratase/2-oxohepta-3-ene-1,7-dioic acid hydratase in catechol pathway